MKTIDRENLKMKLDHGDRFKLIMTMDRNAYDQAHIPGSSYFENPGEAVKQLDPAEEVIVYCSTVYCYKSFTAYQMLRSRGFNKVYRYAGGLEDWQQAGYPLEGSMASWKSN